MDRFPSFILSRNCLRDHTTHPPATDEQSLRAGILGLSTHKVYGCLHHWKHRWAFTSPFHPCSGFSRNGYFLLHYYTLADIFPLGSMALCVVRTFLGA